MIVAGPTPQPVEKMEPLSASLSVGLTEAEKATVAAKAKASGESMSAYARRKILAA